jgi:SAM-dependent methyltransferase
MDEKARIRDSHNAQTQATTRVSRALSLGESGAGISDILRYVVTTHVRHHMAHAFCGSGPGIQTPDGCSVNLYRLLPYMGELADIEDHLKRYPAALELGCGTGRLCARLQAIGLSATGVDESAEMLAQLPPGVEGIKASIEDLALGRRWPAVLLPSHLINHPDPTARRKFAEAARRHIDQAGTFYIKRHSSRWLSTVQVGKINERNGIALYADHVAREGRQVTMTIRYATQDQAWTQSFTTSMLEQDEIEALLATCGFKDFQWLGNEALWVAATPRDG